MAEYPNVERRGNNKFRLWVNAGNDPITGRRRRHSRIFVGGVRAARDEQRRWQADIDAGRYQHPDGQTVASSLDRYLGLAKSKRWTAATIAKNAIIVGHLKRLLGPAPLGDLTPQAITDAYNSALEDRTATTVGSWHDVLRAALNYEVAPRGKLTYNPAAYSVVPRREPVKPKAPTAAAVRKVLGVALTRDPDFYVYLRVTAAAGTRRGETGALRWRHVDLDRSTLTVDSALSIGRRQLVDQGRTKTGVDRTVVLGPATLELIRAHMERKQGDASQVNHVLDGDSYLFSPDPSGTRPYWPSVMGKKMAGVAREAGVAVTLKGFRRFVTSQLLDHGLSPAAVTARQGHSAQVMVRHYAETPDDTARRAGEIIDQLLTG